MFTNACNAIIKKKKQKRTICGHPHLITQSAVSVHRSKTKSARATILFDTSRWFPRVKNEPRLVNTAGLKVYERTQELRVLLILRAF